MAANGTWTLNSQKYTLNTYTHAEVRMLVRFVVWLAVSEIKGRQKSEMHQMSPNWTWTLNSQKYSIYTTYLFTAEAWILVRFALRVTGSRIQGRQKLEIHWITPNWIWTLNSQKYHV